MTEDPVRTEDWLAAFFRRAAIAIEAVNQVLSAEQQARELMPDDTYRVRCSHCGQSVSSPLPVPVIVRAQVECPECIMDRARSRT